MSQMQGLHIKCPKEQKEFLEFACLNKLCKAKRVQYHQCLKNGDHVAQLKDQKNLIELIQFFHKFEQESESLISKLCSIVEEIKKLTIELNQEFGKKYQFHKERLQQLNEKLLNSALDQIMQFDEIKIGLLKELDACSDYMVNQLNIQIKDLKIHQINIYLQKCISQNYKAVTKLTIKQIRTRTKKRGRKSRKIILISISIILNHQMKSTIYYDDQYKEAITFFDAALSIYQNHFNSLYNNECQVIIMIKLYGLIKFCLSIQSISIHYIQKVCKLQINVLAECLMQLLQLQLNIRKLSKYNDAIIWADQVLSINSKHVFSLNTKGESLKQIDNSQYYTKWLNMRKLLRLLTKH